MRFLAMMLLTLLAGCASGPRAPDPDFDRLFDDHAFAPPSQPVGAADLFALSPDMHAYLRSAAFTAQIRKHGLQRGLVAALYEKGELKLEYDSSVTRTAAQTYAAHMGNCMSLVIMTAAFARELGMPVRYQNVEVDESWSRAAGMYLVAGHVNLSLGSRPSEMFSTGGLRNYSNEQMLTVDFLPPEEAGTLRTTVLEEDDIVALYMNNRAAEELVQEHVDQAYWWARAAARTRPDEAVALNTLGVIYARKGNNVMAERVLQAALRREPNNLVVMHNLAPALSANGKTEEARQLNDRIARLQPDPPFFYFNQGMQAFNSGDYRKAKALFAREVKRAPYYDEFHFWLAIACLRLGQQKEAHEQLALAYDNSTRRDMRDLYSAKMAHLRSLEVAGAH